MKTYFAYIRVSTVKQGEQGSSLIEQRAAIEAYAARNNLTIVEWFEEMVTAAKRGRPQFARLTTLLGKGKANGVILHKIDRGARNLKDWADLGELIDAGVEVLFAHEGLDMQTRGGRLAADIQAVVAADYIRNLRQEIRKGFYGRLKQGLYPLPAPRGYIDNGKGNPKTIDPIKGALVKRAFERYATGTVSLEILRHELAVDGLLGSSGKPLSYDALSVLLHNPFYIGLIRIEKTGETFEGIHQPLVSKSTFDRVQAIMAGRLYPRIEKHTFLFRRLIKCQACGRSLTGERQKGHVYYRCHERTCRGVSLLETQVDTLLADELAWLRVDDAQGLGDLREVFAEEIARERATQGDAANAIERDLGAIEVRLLRLTDAFLEEMIDKVAFEERRAELLSRKAKLREKLESGGDSTFWQDVAERFELGLTASSVYIRANDDEKRDAVQTFGSNLIAAGKSPYFPMQFPFHDIREWNKSDDGAPYRGAVRTFGAGQPARRNRNVRKMLGRIAAHQTHTHSRDRTICTETSPSGP